MLRDVKAASTVDKKQYLEIQKSGSSSKSKSEEIIELPTTEAPSGTTPASAQSRKAYYEAWDKFDVVSFDCSKHKLYTGPVSLLDANIRAMIIGSSTG